MEKNTPTEMYVLLAQNVHKLVAKTTSDRKKRHRGKNPIEFEFMECEHEWNAIEMIQFILFFLSFINTTYYF